MENQEQQPRPGPNDPGFVDWLLGMVRLQRLQDPPNPNQPPRLNEPAEPIVGQLEIPPLSPNEAYVRNPVAPNTYMRTVAGARVYNLTDEVNKLSIIYICTQLASKLMQST